MIKDVHPDMVLIKPDVVEEKTAGGIVIGDTTKEKLMKQQNRGIVEAVGTKCTWAMKGDYMSFYRAAATEIKDEETEFVLVHEAHCLVKFKSK